MSDHQHVVERDDGRFEIGLVDPSGPFETREHAQAVASRTVVARMPASVFTAKAERRV